MNTITVKFVNIDNWNRPIFKDTNDNYYGATDILFSQDAPEDEVKKKVTNKDLTYFGKHFNCEPMGTEANKIVIKWKE